MEVELLSGISVVRILWLKSSYKLSNVFDIL